MEPESTGIKWIYDLLGWVDVHRKQVLAGFIGFVLLVIAIYAYVWHRNQVRLQAGAALVQLMNRLGQEPSSVKPEDFLALAKKYKGTPAAQRALLTAAFQYFEKNDYSHAQKIFQQFMEQYPDSIWTPQAALGLAACLDAQNKTKEAEQAYNQVIQDYGNHPAAAQARLKLAVLYEDTGRFSKALAIYNELANLKLFGRVAQIAIQRREELLREHPELAPPPPKQTNQVQALPSSTNLPPVGKTNLLATNALAKPQTNAPKPAAQSKPQPKAQAPTSTNTSPTSSGKPASASPSSSTVSSHATNTPPHPSGSKKTTSASAKTNTAIP